MDGERPHAAGLAFFSLPVAYPPGGDRLMGYHATGSDVDAVAWALPGTPYRPPVSMPGAQYRPGMGGAGYWVQLRRL